jgi:iron complex transport system ATP-binding protein
MGPNGVGKSTLIRTLAQLHPPSKGRILWGFRGTPALVLTDRVSAPHLSVRELVTYGRYPHVDWHLRLRPEDEDIINQSLDQVGISDLSNKKLFEISDGQLQLAMIARALAQQSPLIILDEPTAHLDLNNRVKIMTLLKSLAHERGKAILLASHELDLALQMADVVWLATPHGQVKTGMPEQLVLNGAFDELFPLKGFNLKTGRVEHHPHRNLRIAVHGQSYTHLWTRSALARWGYQLDEDAPLTLLVTEQGGWAINNELFTDLTQLYQYLDQYASSSSPAR